MHVCAYRNAARAGDGGIKKTGQRCGACADCTAHNQAVQRAHRKKHGPMRGESGGLYALRPCKPEASQSFLQVQLRRAAVQARQLQPVHTGGQLQSAHQRPLRSSAGRAALGGARVQSALRVQQSDAGVQLSEQSEQNRNASMHSGARDAMRMQSVVDLTQDDDLMVVTEPDGSMVLMFMED